MYIEKQKEKEAECTSKVEGVIVDIRRERIGSSSGVNNTKTYSYFPVYQYYTRKHALTRKSNKGFAEGKYKIGQSVTVYYNPNNLEDCYVPEFSIKAAGTVFLVLGLCFMILGGSILLKGIIDVLVRSPPMIKKILLALLAVVLLTGCQEDEEKIRNTMLSYMEEKYSEDFEIVDYNYNKTYDCYEIGVQTDAIKDGLAAEVDYYRNGEIYDGYYANLYLTEVTESFENVLGLYTKHYAFSEYLIDMSGPRNKTNSYEEYKSYMNVDTAIVTINLFLESGSGNQDELLQGIEEAIKELENPNCNVDVYFASGSNISEIKDYVTTHYRRYDSDDLLDSYSYYFRVKKRDDIVSIE